MAILDRCRIKETWCGFPVAFDFTYCSKDRQDGPALVIVHGFPDSGFSFSACCRCCRAISESSFPISRGFGESDRPATGYSMTDFAMDVLTLMDDLRTAERDDRRALDGKLRRAAHRRARPRSCRCAGPDWIGGDTAGTTSCGRLLAGCERFTDPIDPAFVREFQLSTTFRTLPAPFLEQLIAESLKVPARVWKAALSGLLADDIGGTASLPNLRDWGRAKMRYSPDAEQEALAALIPGASVTILDGLGHALTGRIRNSSRVAP